MGLFGNIKSLKIAVRPATLENEIIAFCLFFRSHFVRASVRSFCNYFQFTTPKNNNNNKIKDTFLIPGKLTQTSYQNTRATDRRLKHLD